MATKSIAWESGGGYIRLSYGGSGNGSITVESDQNNSASARSKTITVKTTAGGVVTKNLTVSQAACPIPVGTVKNFSFTGNYQEVLLPAGSYKLQCWGAQGGGNGAAQGAGGLGGYSEGVLTLSSPTTVRVYVGGKGGTSAAGWNGGGSSTGYSEYNSGDTYGYSYMGGGGGATDIRLSDGSLYSRMIVAGGGSGAAFLHREITTETQVLVRNLKHTMQTTGNSYWYGFTKGKEYVFVNETGLAVAMYVRDYSGNIIEQIASSWTSGEITYTFPSNAYYLQVYSGNSYTVKVYADEYETETSTDTWENYYHGWVGGGTSGNGFGTDNTYKGQQNAAGRGGSFGQGANQTATNYRYCSGAGGGGWYGGGGGQYSDSDTYCIGYSGGGSGFVNIAANASYRPSGYTGLQLDSGTTKAGYTSFEAPGGGTETGHAGNGYARITRLS